MVYHGLQAGFIVSIHGLVDVHETMTWKDFIDVLVFFTFKLNSCQHCKALVGDALLEVVVSIHVLLGSRFVAPHISRHSHSLSGNTVDQMYQESISIMSFIVIELTIELVLDVADVYKVTIGDEICLSPFSRKYIVENSTEWFGFWSWFLISVSEEISNKSLVVWQ